MPDMETIIIIYKYFQQSVLVDHLAMLGLEGHRMVRQLRAHDMTRDLALIAVSGETHDTDLLQAQTTGFDAHLNTCAWQLR